MTRTLENIIRPKESCCQSADPAATERGRKPAASCSAESRGTAERAGDGPVGFFCGAAPTHHLAPPVFGGFHFLDRVTGVERGILGVAAALFVFLALALLSYPIDADVKQQPSQSVPDLIAYLNDLEMQYDPPLSDLQQTHHLFVSLHDYIRQTIVEQGRK